MQIALPVVLFSLTVLFGFGSAVYSAFLFWQAKGRDFWQSPLFSVHLIVMAILAGSGMMIVVDDGTPAVGGVLLVSLILHAGIILFDLTAVHSTADSKIACAFLGKSRLFWLGAVIAGILLPITLLFLGETGIAGLFALGGLLLYEKVWVKAGQVVPLS
jgi:formate-dependent nitrite reductase membrane component NrfD